MADETQGEHEAGTGHGGTDEERTGTPAPEGLEAMLRRQRREAQDTWDRQAAEQRKAGDDLLNALRGDAHSILSISFRRIVSALAAQRQTGEFRAIPVRRNPPGDILRDLENAVEEQTATGSDEPVYVLYMPVPDAYGLQEKKAWLIADVSAEVWA